jgi:hypothetical protein
MPKTDIDGKVSDQIYISRPIDAWARNEDRKLTAAQPILFTDDGLRWPLTVFGSRIKPRTIAFGNQAYSIESYVIARPIFFGAASPCRWGCGFAVRSLALSKKAKSSLFYGKIVIG